MIRSMARWEGYLLGALGITVTVVSIVMQIAWFAAGRHWPALGLTLGVLGGALLYRSGYRGVTG